MIQNPCSIPLNTASHYTYTLLLHKWCKVFINLSLQIKRSLRYRVSWYLYIFTRNEFLVKLFWLNFWLNFWGSKILYLTFFISHQCLNGFCSNFQGAFLMLCKLGLLWLSCNFFSGQLLLNNRRQLMFWEL